jgi:hypothetical protein
MIDVVATMDGANDRRPDRPAAAARNCRFRTK